MVYLINVLIMRSFAYKNVNFEKDIYVPELKEGNPCYQASIYDPVMLEELSDGSFMYMDMTSILLNQEKYRRLLGDMNVQSLSVIYSSLLLVKLNLDFAIRAVSICLKLLGGGKPC